jgi:hypothetical protein
MQPLLHTCCTICLHTPPWLQLLSPSNRASSARVAPAAHCRPCDLHAAKHCSHTGMQHTNAASGALHPSKQNHTRSQVKRAVFSQLLLSYSPWSSAVANALYPQDFSLYTGLLLLLLPCTSCNGDCYCCDERQLRLQLCHSTWQSRLPAAMQLACRTC